MKRFFSGVLSAMIIFAVCLMFSGCATKTAYTYDGAENYLSGNVAFDISEVHTIDVDWISGNVNVEVVDDIECLSVEETSRYTILEDEALRYKLGDDGVLIIKFRASNKKKVNLTKEKDLTIKLPKAKFIKSNLIINSVSADVYVNRVETTKIRVSNISGEITIINSRASITEVNNVSGEIKLKNSVLYGASATSTSGDIIATELTTETIDVENVSGNVSMEVDTTPLSIDAETVSGNIDLKFINDKGFTAEFKSASGSFNSGFETVLTNGKYVYLDGSYNYEFETVSGNVTINKK